MSIWYRKVVSNLGQLPPALDYFNDELIAARSEISVKGRLEISASTLPGVVELRFNQLQEIEAILNYLNIELRKIRRNHFKAYMETYARTLSARDAEKYVDGEDEVVNQEILINEVALCRNKWLGIIKGLEMKGFSINNVIKLRCAGLEDATLN